MTDHIVAALNQIPDAASLAQATHGIYGRLQEKAVFDLALVKEIRMRRLREIFRRGPPRRLFISENLALAAEHLQDWDVTVVSKQFLLGEDGVSFSEKALQLANAVVIVNNNDVHKAGGLERYSTLFQLATNTFFIAWDWDNHHWLSLSCPLAALSDLYCPAHYENLYPLTRFNHATCVVPCGVIQWSRDFLTANLEELKAVNRQSMPLGKHIFYNGFAYRNQVITTLSPHCPSVGFSTVQFHQLTPEEKFREWVQYKIHLIVPVLNDEHIGWAWITSGTWPRPMHPGLWSTVNLQSIQTKLASIENGRMISTQDVVVSSQS